MPPFIGQSERRDDPSCGPQRPFYGAGVNPWSRAIPLWLTGTAGDPARAKTVTRYNQCFLLHNERRLESWKNPAVILRGRTVTGPKCIRFMSTGKFHHVESAKSLAWQQRSGILRFIELHVCMEKQLGHFWSKTMQRNTGRPYMTINKDLM